MAARLFHFWTTVEGFDVGRLQRVFPDIGKKAFYFNDVHELRGLA